MKAQVIKVRSAGILPSGNTLEHMVKQAKKLWFTEQEMKNIWRVLKYHREKWFDNIFLFCIHRKQSGAIP